jgi:hypothetical protein
VFSDDSCFYNEDGYDCSGECIDDIDEDGVCDEFEVEGCTLSVACNFNPSATENDGSCDFVSCFEFGCTDYIACNYSNTADYEDGSCTYSEEFFACDGSCSNDVNLNGICDEFEIYGCLYLDACNYNPEANVDDGLCDFTCLTHGCTNSLAVNYNSDASVEDGSCIIIGCMDLVALNFDFNANLSCGCEYPEVCPGDFNGDGEVAIEDLLDFFLYWANVCE